MTNKLKIIFYGTPAFATGVLKVLHESDYEVVAVVTAPDKPAGRGRSLQQSDVKQYALKVGLTLLQPTNLKDEGFINELRALEANLQVIVAFRMLPKVVWNMPQFGTFNLHASILPKYRGAAPINWAIINGDQETGVTTFFIDDKIDTGAIISQMRCPIENDETAGTLHDKLLALGCKLTLETVAAIALNIVKTSVQPDNAQLAPAPKLDAENTTINWHVTANQIDALVRGLNPYPVAKTWLVQKETVPVKIFKTAAIEKNHDMQPGTIIIDYGEILVACKNGFIKIIELQLPNKKRMTSKDLLNGYTFEPNAMFTSIPQ